MVKTSTQKTMNTEVKRDLNKWQSQFVPSQYSQYCNKCVYVYLVQLILKFIKGQEIPTFGFCLLSQQRDPSRNGSLFSSAILGRTGYDHGGDVDL